MNNDFINQFNNSSKASFETFQQFNELNVEAMQKLAALQFNLTTLNVESTAEQARLLASVTSPDALIEAESELAKNYGEKLVEITNEANAVLTESREQLVAFAEKTFKVQSVQAETAKPAAKTTKKKTRKKVVKKAA